MRVDALATGAADPRQADHLRVDALNRAREALDGFRAGAPDDPAVQRQAAFVHRYAARFTNDAAAAESAYAAAIAIWRDLAGRSPREVDLADNPALALSDYAAFQKRDGWLTAALATLDKAAGLAEGLRGRATACS